MTKREFWNRYLRAYDGLNMLEVYRAYVDDVASRACRKVGARILDAGSGTGNISMRMRQLGAEVTSLDFSPVALAIHREKDPTARQVEASLECPLPFNTGSFDGVVCASVLFALPKAEVYLSLREFRRILRPGGRLLVTSGRKGLSKMRFARDHVLGRLRNRPLLASVREARRILWPFLRLTYYNLRMYGLARVDGYRQFTRDGLVSVIGSAGFVQLAYDTSYAGLLHVVEARAPFGDTDDPFENSDAAPGDQVIPYQTSPAHLAATADTR